MSADIYETANLHPYRSQDLMLSTTQERLEALIQTLEWNCGHFEGAIDTTYRAVSLTIILLGTDYQLMAKPKGSTDYLHMNCKTTVLEEIFYRTKQKEVQKRHQEIQRQREEVLRLLGID